MSTEKALEGEINMEVALKCLQNIEDYLNKGMKAGSYEMKDVYTMYESFLGVSATVKQCDLLQKKLKHLIRQQELLTQAEAVAPKQV